MSVSGAESGVVMKEAVEGVLAMGGVSDGGVEEVMQGSGLDSDSTDVSLPGAGGVL